jgi:hypothetical protein
MNREETKFRAVAEVYPTLAAHQRDEEWHSRTLVTFLQEWAERFIAEFKLEIPQVVLGVQDLPKDRFAQFRYGHNAFGLIGEITFNSRHLDGSRETWEILGTLLHELLHGWQQAHGKPGKRNHHNAEFRDKGWELGLIIDRRGVTGYREESAFKTLLQERGVQAPQGQQLPTRPQLPSKAKLKKWSCGCRPPVNVRVAVAKFRARCLDCGCEFERQEPRQLSPAEGSIGRATPRGASSAFLLE